MAELRNFIAKYFITSVSPLGFVKNGINLNYYDDKKLQETVRPFIISSIQKQIAMGFKTDRCICIGGDKNLKFFLNFNKDYHFFDEIISLAPSAIHHAISPEAKEKLHSSIFIGFGNFLKILFPYFCPPFNFRI